MQNSNIERMRKHVEDTLIHKQLFTSSCIKMINYLYEEQRSEEALELARRCTKHDDSKLSDEEIEYFLCLPVERYGVNAQHSLTEEQMEFLKPHWKNNRHHPEHFTDCNSMNSVDLMEMCCDWYARIEQFHGKDRFLDYVRKVQRTRFSFNDDKFDEILGYCNVLIKADMKTMEIGCDELKYYGSFAEENGEIIYKIFE